MKCSWLFRNWFRDIYGYFPPARERKRARNGVGGMPGQGKETRKRILETLADGPFSVSELASRLDMTRNGIRHNLKILEGEGLAVNVGTSHRGKWEVAQHG